MPLIAADEISGTFVGAGGCCAPSCQKYRLEPACGGGLCVYPTTMGIPCFPTYVMPCGECYWTYGFALWTVDQDTISTQDPKCGKCAEFKREDGGAPPTAAGPQAMER